MDKNTKMLLGVGAVAVAGYLVYQQMNKTKSFATGSTSRTRRTKCKNGIYAVYMTNPTGGVVTEFHDCKTGEVTGTSLGEVKF